jgi:hypothetical protein
MGDRRGIAGIQGRVRLIGWSDSRQTQAKRRLTLVAISKPRFRPLLTWC